MFVNKNFVEKCELSFLNRLEKIILSFKKLLDNDLKILSQKIIEKIQLKSTIDSYKNKINFSLKDLLINCGTEEIQGLIFNFSKVSKLSNNELKKARLERKK